MPPGQTNGWQPRLELLSWTQFAALPDSCRLVVVPVGAIEQHGPHLPLWTDAMNVQAVARDAAAAEGVLVAPTIDYGVSPNHLSFPGTISLRQRTLVELLIDIGDSLATHRVPAVLFVNGNGGNADAMRFACGELRQHRRDLLVGYTDIGDIRADLPLRSGVVYHADETETSHTLHVDPTAVRLEDAVNEMTGPFMEHYGRYYGADGDLHGVVSYGLPPTELLSRSGVMGDATVASADLGARWHATLVDAVRAAIADIKRRVGGTNPPDAASDLG